MRRTIDASGDGAYARDVGRAKTRSEKTSKRPTKGLGNMVAVRLDDEDFARLNALADRITVASRHALAREALRIGLAMLEREPERLLGARPPRSRR